MTVWTVYRDERKVYLPLWSPSVWRIWNYIGFPAVQFIPEFRQNQFISPNFIKISKYWYATINKGLNFYEVCTGVWTAYDFVKPKFRALISQFTPFTKTKGRNEGEPLEPTHTAVYLGNPVFSYINGQFKINR